MKTIGIIPARYASTRFPGKPLVKIAGKSLIQRVYERASLSMLGKVIVATDDERIKSEVLSFGGNAVMTGEHNSGTDRVAEAAGRESCDAVINIQGDEPLIDPRVINTVIDALNQHSWAHVATAALKLSDKNEIENPNIVKAVFSQNGRALYFSRSVVPYFRNGESCYYKHIGIYGYRKDFLQTYITLPQTYLEKAESLEQLRVLENGYSIHVSVVEYDCIGVDVPEDVKKVERALSA